MLDKSIREIERERQSLQTQEKKLIAEIKKTAKQGQMVSFSQAIKLHNEFRSPTSYE
jgi:seryl-tRNA synthetase